MRKALASALVWVLLSAGPAGAADLLKIPKPTDKLDPPPPPPALDASVISLLVSAPIDLLEQAVDGALPAEEGEEKRWLDGSQLVGKPGFQYQYRIWRGKPQVKAIRDHLEVSFPDMKYRFRGRLASDSGPFGGSCGYDDPPKGLAPQGVVQLSWSPDGTLRTSTEFDPAAFPEACKLSPVDVDATPIIRKLVADRLPATGEGSRRGVSRPEPFAEARGATLEAARPALRGRAEPLGDHAADQRHGSPLHRRDRDDRSGPPSR